MIEHQKNLLRRSNRGAIAPCAIYDLDPIFEDLRVSKDRAEIAALQKAADITAEAYEYVMANTTAGMYEYEIEAMLFYAFRKAGADRLSFPSIVASGSNSTILHYIRNNRKIGARDLLLVDSGAEYRHYAADVTRTWPVNGKFSAAQKAIYEVVLAAQKSAIAEIKPGVEINHIHHLVCSEIAQGLSRLKILRGSAAKILENKEYSPYFMHFTGHFLGLEVHDIGGAFHGPEPRKFEEGMVITVEPGLYFREDDDTVAKRWRGIGVRIEDDVLVTATGHEILTAAVPKEIEDLEKILRKKR